MDFMNNGFPYWTGFYCTHPYLKRFERIIHGQLRAFDILSAFIANTNTNQDEIIIARQNLALFQHHDAITGTSTRQVMDDYLNR